MWPRKICVVFNLVCVAALRYLWDLTFMFSFHLEDIDLVKWNLAMIITTTALISPFMGISLPCLFSRFSGWGVALWPPSLRVGAKPLSTAHITSNLRVMVDCPHGGSVCSSLCIANVPIWICPAAANVGTEATDAIAYLPPASQTAEIQLHSECIVWNGRLKCILKFCSCKPF